MMAGALRQEFLPFELKSHAAVIVIERFNVRELSNMSYESQQLRSVTRCVASIWFRMLFSSQRRTRGTC